MSVHDKLLTLPDLLTRRSRAREEGRTVVHCHGCFDIVHPGHIRHLRYARELGDVLLVSITGDVQVNKGAGRPLIPEELRAENLAALDCVDWVYVEPGPTAKDLLSQVQPDIYIKGREYEFNNDPRFRAEMEEVEKAGGRVVFSSGDVVFSSTALIEAMEHSVDPYHQRIASLVRRDDLRGDILTDAIAGLRQNTVVVVGEVIRDTYILCDRPEVASESPVMTLRPLESRQYDGGAAIIARHLASMGARPILVTALGSSPHAREMRSRLVSEGIQVRDIHIEQDVPEKQRFLVGAQKVMKVDQVEQVVLDARQQDDFVALAEAAAQEASDGAIVADFGLGLLSAPLVQRLSVAMRPHVRILAGDVSGRRAALRSMREMDLLCPSEEELRTAYRMYQEGLPAVAWKLMEETATKHIMVTMAGEGLIAFQPREGGSGQGWQSRLHSEHIPALNPIAIDALGCGDAMLAASTLALCQGQPLMASAFLGAVAAGLESQRVGNVPISARDLRRGVARIRDLNLAYVVPEVIPPRPGAPRRIAS